EEQADFFTTKDREVLGKGVLVDIPEEKIQAAAGDERWLHTKKIPLRGSDGKPAFLLGISEDITEKRAREEELRRSNDRFDKILKMSPTAIFVSEVETGFFLYVNETFCRLFQVSGKEVAGKTSVDLGISTPERRAEITQNMMRNNGRVRGLEFRYEPAHGEAADLLMSSEIVEFEGKKCFLGSISDITERKRSEEKIARLNDELEESLRQLGTVNKELEAFTYSVSHDLRAPLRAVSGYANMLEEEYNQLLDEEGRRLLGVIRYNAKKMGQLIDDLLAFSRLGRKEIETRPENMQTLVEGVMIELRKTIDYKAKITIGELHTANVDYGLMHQVFLNLISNAIKYSSKKKKPEISISSEVREGEIIYSIRDNGVGFDMRYYDKLFGVFQRLHKMEEFEGTGVGLAIVQRIISKHRGRVWAEAAVNKGANFSFSLPAEKPASLTQTAYGRNQEH
ncbi:MAG TPA: ATP-binding protein, partial [Bacteroidia bacterium]|nr:ATP-binding protein [Bacteroidia bacterium]